MKKESKREQKLKEYTVTKLDCKALSDLLSKDLKEVNYPELIKLKSTDKQLFVTQTF